LANFSFRGTLTATRRRRISQPRTAQDLSKGETMSMKLEHDPADDDATARMTWVEADAGFWVGNAGGAFGGCVDRVGHVYRAMDPQGRHRGDFRRLAEAKRCLEAFLAHPAMHGARGMQADTAARGGAALTVS
jgi:hypothetical protein